MRYLLPVFVFLFLYSVPAWGQQDIPELRFEWQKIAELLHPAGATQQPGLAGASFWVVLFGGLAANLTQYGSDQTIIQRYLTTKDERATARQWQQKAVAMVDILLRYGGASAGKGFMKLIGIDCGWCRPPLAPLNRAQLKAMEKELETIGFFDFCSKP